MAGSDYRYRGVWLIIFDNYLRKRSYLSIYLSVLVVVVNVVVYPIIAVNKYSSDSVAIAEAEVSWFVTNHTWPLGSPIE